MGTKNIEMTRFDTRLSKEQKALFELAANLGGFRTLTEFVINSVLEKAEKIINEHNTVGTSIRDRKIFFDAILNPEEPNKKLQEAAKRYKKETNE